MSLSAALCRIACASVVSAVCLSASNAQAEKAPDVLYAFRGVPDGAFPFAPLIGVGGSLYGTTNSGGLKCGKHLRLGCGTIFRIAPDGKEQVLHSFMGGCDGEFPSSAGLVSDNEGNFYGTTSGGGICRSSGFGTVFELTANGKEHVLYAFTGGADGIAPDSVIADKNGNLYGVTGSGGTDGPGCNDGCGTVFKLTPEGTKTVLYRFQGGDDGMGPQGPLVEDESGNLYGVTVGGGTNGCDFGCGTVFKIAPDGKETILYAFQGISDGAGPSAGLILDKSGNLYGTTASGGGANDGTVFKLAADGSETVLHAFTGGADGAFPVAPLIMDNKGNLYGTAEAGGNTTVNGCKRFGGCGTVFKLAPDGTATVLVSFNKADGRFVEAGLLLGKHGELYGTTAQGGDKNKGVVFEVKK